MARNMFINRVTRPHIFLVAIIMICAVINISWIVRNKTAPTGNGLTDLFPAINFYLDVSHNNTPAQVLLTTPMNFTGIGHFFKILSEYIRYSFFIYPPWAPLSYSFTYFIFGLNSHLELTVNILYFSLALWALYSIGRMIVDERVGLLTVFIFSTFPGVIVKTRQIYSEFFMMCLMPLVFLFLLKTDLFRKRKYSVLFGISLGIMALTKWEFILTFLAPFILYLFYSFYSLRKSVGDLSGRSAFFVNLLVSIFIAIMISLLWYYVGFQDVYWRIFCYDADSVMPSLKANLPPSWLSYKINYYLISLANGGVHFFYFCFFILTSLFVISNVFFKKAFLSIKIKFFWILFIGLWILVPYFLLSFITARNLSHALVILPAAALVISLGVLGCRNIFLRRLLIGLIIIYGVCAYARSFVIIKPLDFINSIRLTMTPNGNLRLELVKLNHPLVFAWEGKRLYEPDERDWKYKEIISFIQQDSRSLGRKPLVYFLGPPIEEFTVFTLQYYNLLTGFSFFLEPRGNDKSEGPPDRSRFDYVAILNNKKVTDRMLDELLVLAYNVDYKNHKIDLFRKEFFQKFSYIREFSLPNGSQIYIYKRNVN